MMIARQLSRLAVRSAPARRAQTVRKSVNPPSRPSGSPMPNSGQPKNPTKIAAPMAPPPNHRPRKSRLKVVVSMRPSHLSA